MSNEIPSPENSQIHENTIVAPRSMPSLPNSPPSNSHVPPQPEQHHANQPQLEQHDEIIEDILESKSENTPSPSNVPPTVPKKSPGSGWLGKLKFGSKKIEDDSNESYILEIERLKALLAESLKRHEEAIAAAEIAIRERDESKIKIEQLLSNDITNVDVIAELSLKRKDLETALEAERLKAAALDSANVGLADMLRVHEQKIETLEKSGTTVLESRNSLIETQEKRIRELEAEVSLAGTRSTSQISELTQKFASTFEMASTRIRELEQMLAVEEEKVTTRISSLEKQLAKSEARSANRAEQRSALLRNMAQIHRLSAFASKTELPSESAKSSDSEPSNSEWSDGAEKTPERSESPEPTAESQNDSTEAIMMSNQLASPWGEQNDGESA